ncbi:YraN family protein [Sphingomonas sp. DBB INV C78]|uniref:YraN family protein n=1 Tax=Sphingomonas sp. DBB INV C78 TaxID=3349434 RepID=UPI0036D3BF76
MSRQAAERTGRRGETIAAWWLRLHGWKIVGPRVRTPVGEVDLVARRGRTVAFIEVKTRRTEAELDLSIDRRRLVRVAQAAEMLGHRYARQQDFIRIDVILIRPRAWPRHITNVWHG